MKRVYEVKVFFDYPQALFGMRERRTYLVEAGSIGTAAKLGTKLARRDRNGGYAPRIERIDETGFIDAR